MATYATLAAALKGINSTILETAPATGYAGQPMSQLSAGEGRAATLYSVEDSIALPVDFFAATANVARLCRIPANAKIKRVTVFSDGTLDQNATAASAFNVGLIWSNTPGDGTPANLNGLIPTTANTGATTTVAAFSTPNNLFGTVNPLTKLNSGIALVPTDITFNGVGSTYPMMTLLQEAVVNIFGYKTTAGYNIPNLGWFDFYIESQHAYGTVPSTSQSLGLRCEYVA
jgi:hypothetical protein